MQAVAAGNGGLGATHHHPVLTATALSARARGGCILNIELFRPQRRGTFWRTTELNFVDTKFISVSRPV